MNMPWISLEDQEQARKSIQEAIEQDMAFLGIKLPLPRKDISKVSAHLFKQNGKWKHEVFLDYTGILTEDGKPVDPSIQWLSPGEAALRALYQATTNGTSGVSLETPHVYHLVVFDPPNGFPVMVVSVEPES